MLRWPVAGAILCVCLFGDAVCAQVPAKIDFRRDVQPIFKTYCIGCHGPTQQMNGFRLDRRSDAMRGGTIAVIGPGNSAGSRLYQKLIGDEYGLRMPPTGPLSPDQINTIKAWLDQGAEWPDDVSGETPAPPPDPAATRMMDALRNGDRPAFQKILREDPKAASRKGPGGSTPLMYAALYGGSDSVRRLLESGADPNLRNEAGATALMWAAGGLEKTQLLVSHGGDVNARSDYGRTPLMIAAGRFGSVPIVKLLLDHHADPSAHSPSFSGPMTPLAEAAYVSDDNSIRLLIERGADVKGAGVNPLSLAILAYCAKCIDTLIGLTVQNDLNVVSVLDGPPNGDAQAIKLLLDHKADINSKDPDGNTLLMLAASSELLPVEVIKTLIARGVDVNAKNPKGETALDFAARHGRTPIVDLLVQAGAKPSTTSSGAALTAEPAPSLRAAVERSIPLLQNSSRVFLRKSGCISCHNNTLTYMTLATARRQGIAVNDQIVANELKTITSYIESWRERVLQGVGIPGDSDTISAILVGLADAKVPPDPATDALAMYLKNHQAPDGRWFIVAHRPPLESSDFQVTALSLRALQAYAPTTQRPQYQKAIQAAAGWLTSAQPKTTHDRAYQLLGLAWAGARPEVIRGAADALLTEQRTDGGWAQLPSLTSDAYATGQALVALRQARVLAVTDPRYQRGSQFLRDTQLKDGSWYVKTRAIRIQPYFESDFPHGRDQFISAAATNWATTALALAMR